MSHYRISVLPILLLPHLAGNSASVLSRGLSLPASPTYTLLWSYWPFSLFLRKSRRYISTTKGHPWLAHKLTPVITAWPLPWRQSPADLSARTPSQHSALGIELSTSEHQWTQSSSPTVSVTLPVWPNLTESHQRGKVFILPCSLRDCIPSWWQEVWGCWSSQLITKKMTQHSILIFPPCQKNWSCELMARYLHLLSYLPPTLSWGGVGRVLNQHGKANRIAVVSCLGWECFGVGLSLTEDHRQFD